MSLSALPMFSSKSFIVSSLTFRSLIHFESSLCMVLESVLGFEMGIYYSELSGQPNIITCNQI